MISHYSAHAIADAASATYDDESGITSDVRACTGVAGRYSAFGVFVEGKRDPIITVEQMDSGRYRVCDYSSCSGDLSCEEALVAARDIATIFGKEDTDVAR